MPKKPSKKNPVTAEVLRDLLETASRAQKRAYAPYSRYLVGAALLTEDGQTIGGCNVENASFGATVCAERNAIGSMIASGQSKPQALVVVTSSSKAGAPCGICRQMLLEFGSPDMKVYLFSAKDLKSSVPKPQKTMRLRDLVPYGFDMSFLSSFKG